MPQRKTPRDAKASKTKPARAKSKSAKPRGKASALGEAVDAASQAIYSPGDASVSASASTRSRRRGSPDVPPDDRPNPRFVHRDRSPGSPSDLEHCSSPGAVSHDEGDAPSHKGASEDVSSVHGDLSGDGDNVPKSPADTGSTNASAAGGQKDGDAKAASPAKRLTLGEGLQRARDAKAKEAASKKRIASRSPPKGRTRGLDVIKSPFDSSESNSEDEEGQVHVPEEVANALDEQQERLQEARMRQRLSPPAPQPTPGGGASGERDSKHPRGYFPPDENTGSPLFLERLGAPRGLIGGPTSRGAYERDLIQKVDLFTEDIEAARCVLLAPHRMPLKEFTTLRKKGENRGGLHPVWGYPWVQPENTYTVAQAEDLFWRWVGLRGHSAQELDELKEDRLLHRILDQRDLRIQFAHLECGDLHSRVDRRALSYDVDCLRDEVAHLRSEIQNRPSYPGYREPQSYAYSQPYYGSYPYGGASSRSQAYAYDQSPAPASAWRSPQREAGARFEVVNSPPQNPLSLPAGDQKPEGRGSASDDPHKTSGGSSST
uniref:ATP-binding cassette (ABC) Superfamily n=1 Tax=Phytophthora ramorum TaxID=164328 RepID=H3GCV7_PHYRM